MSSQSPSKKSLPVIIGGIALTLAASYFGFDLGPGSDGGRGGSAATSARAAATATTGASAARATSTATGTSTEGTCALDSLPTEAEDTVDDILAGGPYEHPANDNKRFGNYEGVLPREKSNYYREYTVDTPGLDHRGTRRIVTGGGSETDPDVWYYTDDHYESFCVIPDAEQPRS